jgi:hypothetical protein
MYIRNLGGDNYSVNVNSIVLVGETRSISSSGTQDVRLDPYGSIWLFRNNESLTDIRIAVNSSYPSSWAESFNTSALAAGLIYSTDFMVTEGENYASISLFPTGSLELYLRESTIGVSTGIF